MNLPSENTDVNPCPDPTDNPDPNVRSDVTLPLDAGRPPDEVRPTKLSLNAIGRNYGSFHALRSVSLDVNTGEYLVILGPSGSGKSTLLKLIAGFDHATSGSILLDGQDITTTPAYERNIGMVFQDYALFPHLTVFGNVAFPLSVRGTAKATIRKQVAEKLRLVGLEGFEQRKIHSLSGGQQQRIALARGLVFEPTLLLLDEPLSALDKQLREQMQIELRRIHDEVGTTFIGVTHDQREALIMADRVVVMNAGRIEQIGTPAEVYYRPANRFVAQFIGETTLMEGKPIHWESDGERTHGIVRVKGLADLHGFAHGTHRAVDETVSNEVVSIMVRPERVRLSEPTHHGETPAQTNALSGLIEDVKFSGEFLELSIRTSGGWIMKAKEPAGSFNVAGTRQKGASVHLQWDYADTVILTG